MPFFFNPLKNKSVLESRKYLVEKMEKKRVKYSGKLHFPELNLLINKFVKKGHKLRIRCTFFKVFCVLKLALKIVDMAPLLCLTILFFSPLYSTTRLSKRKGKRRKRYERPVFKKMISFDRGVCLATRFVYKAILYEQKRTGCKLLEAGVLEIFRLLREPKNSITYVEYKTHVTTTSSKKTLRFDIVRKKRKRRK